jgi:murein DD-endopeptidase MepM/ murein hydrolase activator NlpD
VKTSTALVAAGAGALAFYAYARYADARHSSPKTKAPKPQTAAAPPSSRSSLAFGRPVPTSVRALVSGGWARPRGERIHRALDIPVPVGTPIWAIDAGWVSRAQTEDESDAGIWVGVLHDSGVTSRYLHLSECKVEPGQRVARGDVLGLAGSTGRSTGPHLHLDLRVPDYLLPWIASQVGTPLGGWGPELKPHGFSIPGEPWIPVDDYRDIVKTEAAAAGIPLYSEVRHGG